MKITKFTILGLIICILAASAISANSGKMAIAIRRYQPIVIDGRLGDWTEAIPESDWHARLLAKKGKFMGSFDSSSNFLNTTTSLVEAGEVSSLKDFSGVFYLMWDEKKIYFAARIIDDQVITRHQDGDIWQDDSIEVWLDLRHDAVTEKLKQDDEYQIGFSPGSKTRIKTVGWVWRNPEPEKVIKALEYDSSLTDDGYIIEAAIPFSVLKGANPEIGSVIGFNISGVDNDENEAWTHITWSGKLHSDPTEFGDLLYIDAPIELSTEVLKR